jgi:hypothetical protein
MKLPPRFEKRKYQSLVDYHVASKIGTRTVWKFELPGSNGHMVIIKYVCMNKGNWFGRRCKPWYPKKYRVYSIDEWTQKEHSLSKPRLIGTW